MKKMRANKKLHRTAAGRNPANGHWWPPLQRGRLVKRYQRFLADVVLDSGPTVTAHCPNSGRMTGCNQPGRPVYLSLIDNPKGKLKYRWELIDMPTGLVGVNTMVPNRLVADSIRGRRVPELAGYNEVFSEVKINARSRLDLKLCAPGLPDCYIEVKNCTLVEDGCAMFPDAPTLRGRKHLTDLVQLTHSSGARAIIFFLVQRADARFFAPADAIDPEYGRLLRQVAGRGVEIMVYDTDIDLKRIRLRRPLPCRL
jgi:sugar fermentation stimulation protein A